MEKLIFVLLDGLGLQEAKNSLGYLEHLTEAKQCAKYEVNGELPSLSRPMYETIFTGMPVYMHGITNNLINRMSNQVSVFDLCKENQGSSLVCGYHWLSELYVKSPFDVTNDVILDKNEGKITEGFFYYEDSFPDTHLYSIANEKLQKNKYDFVVIHPMNIDYAGHLYGSGSVEYEKAAKMNDICLSGSIPMWLEMGYQVMVGADHGMNTNKMHGGNTESQRNTALYIISDKIETGCMGKKLTSLQLAPTMCMLLGISKGVLMENSEVILVD